tara:strand:+ start:298 stop:594 length:297 start_codon:yes stop_codon:yes gene_type:complete
MKVLNKIEVDNKFKLLSKNWRIKDHLLTAEFNFKTFDDAFDFMQIISKKCKDLNHHPKWTNIYNRVDVELFTHDLGGLSSVDFELATFMDLSFSSYSQ